MHATPSYSTQSCLSIGSCTDSMEPSCLDETQSVISSHDACIKPLLLPTPISHKPWLHPHHLTQLNVRCNEKQILGEFITTRSSTKIDL